MDEKQSKSKKNYFKKILYIILNAVSVIIVACSVCVLLIVVFTPRGQVPKVMGYSVMRVLTGSMQPAIATNSIVLVKECDMQQVQVGDVISFYSDDPSLNGMINTHRVIDIKYDGEDIQFVTKGDANAIEDRYITRQSDFIGVVVGSSHGLGVMVRLLSNPLVFIPCIIIPLLFMLFYYIRQTIITAKQMEKAQEEAFVAELLKLQKNKAENSTHSSDK